MSELNTDNDRARPLELRTALESRYLAYAVSTITQRALPDLRDGLKPVHRRLLHAMRELKLDPKSGYKKCARVVGDVIGKFHPHGDQAVYDTLVRLAQEFSLRYPLIEGQGNFGSIDGDNAAAMRYTEARLTDVAELLLAGLDEDGADFRETYDGEEEEPVVLPGLFPNLLANGASGIAVGMATAIPPHNIGEICSAAIALLQQPDLTLDDLLQIIKGPDLPTGGLLVRDASALRLAYESGRGSFRIQARWHRETLERGAWRIIVTEIPYQIQKSKLIEKIAELFLQRKLPLLEEIIDESAEDIRIVLLPKSRNVDPDMLMHSLFAQTEMESRISLNMNVLSEGHNPMILGIKAVLEQWLSHKQAVLIRRSNFRLGRLQQRMEILSGYLAVFAELDTIIRIIRESDDPKGEIVVTFSLSENQAEAILNMRLRALRRLEEIELRAEFGRLSKKSAEIEKLLAKKSLQQQHLIDGLLAIKKTYDEKSLLGRRRTGFVDDTKNEAVERRAAQTAAIRAEPITIIISQMGWIRTLSGHVAQTETLGFKQGDRLFLSIPAEQTDLLILMATNGKFFALEAGRLSQGRGAGDPIRLLAAFDEGTDIAAAFIHKPDRQLLVASRAGRGFITEENGVVASTKKGKQIFNIDPDDEALCCVEATGDQVGVIGTNRKLLIFPLQQVPRMNRGRGARLQRYRDSELSDVAVFYEGSGLSWQDSSNRTFTRTMAELENWRGSRAQAGRPPPSGFPRANLFDATLYRAARIKNHPVGQS